jgi:hypothetical protein
MTSDTAVPPFLPAAVVFDFSADRMLGQVSNVDRARQG